MSSIAPVNFIADIQSDPERAGVESNTSAGIKDSFSEAALWRRRCGDNNGCSSNVRDSTLRVVSIGPAFYE